jgi:hypothetical protein
MSPEEVAVVGVHIHAHRWKRSGKLKLKEISREWSELVVLELHLEAILFAGNPESD